MADKEKKLTSKQARFAKEYLVDLNATAAASRAGYSARTAYSSGQRNLKNPEVQRVIRAGMEAQSKRTEITADRVINELAAIAFTRADDVFEINDGHVRVKNTAEMSANTLKALASASETTTENGCTVNVKLRDKLKALELLGRHLALFTDKAEISGPGGAPLSPPTIQVAFITAHDDES